MFDYNKTFNDLDIKNKCKALYVICCILILLICLCSILCIYDTYYAWHDLPDNKMMIINIPYCDEKMVYDDANMEDYFQSKIVRYINTDINYIQYRKTDDYIYIKRISKKNGKYEFITYYKAYSLRFVPRR